MSNPTPVDFEEALLQEFMRRKRLRKDAKSYLKYVRERAPWFVVEEWHVLLAEKFEALFNGEIDRLMVFAPPRAGKSQNTSGFLPEWWVGNRPEDQVLHTSYAGTLVEKFGRNIRNVIAKHPTFRDMFPTVELARDSKSSSRWNTAVGGEYNAAGVGAGIAGKGFHLGIIDDPISEQDAPSRTLRQNTNEWYGPGFYTRRMPERNAIVLTQTRWAVDDLSGYLLANAIADPEADQWEILKIPAMIDGDLAKELNRVARDPKYQEFLQTDAHPYPMTYKEGDSFSPRRWPLKLLLRTKANMSRRDWAALYMQNPIKDGGNIIKREYWRKWPKDRPIPKFEYIIQSYDTAFEPEETNDFSARTTWGVFRREDDGRHCAFLISRMKERLEFPDLLSKALDKYKEERPDRVIIEKKASGHSLLQEFRRRGIPITPMTGAAMKGSRAVAKEVRLHAASVLFEQGCVYYPEGRRWAEDVVDTVCAFPNGEEDDTTDTVAHAMIYLRKTFHLDAPDDEPEEENHLPVSQKQRSYATLHGNYQRLSGRT